jgi:hypothetical protein
MLRLLGVAANGVRVPVRAQIVDPLQVGPVRAQPADVRSGREQRGAEAHFLLARQLHDALGGVELHRARPGQELDVVLLPPLLGLHEGVVARLFAPEVALGERRAIVGRVRLAPDD